MKVKNKSLINKLELNDIFRVELVDGKKQISRWGFYASQGDGTYAIYKPEKPVCDVGELFGIDEDGPGAIDIVPQSAIETFLTEIGDRLHGIPATSVSEITACGWYYDTLC